MLKIFANCSFAYILYTHMLCFKRAQVTRCHEERSIHVLKMNCQSSLRRGGGGGGYVAHFYSSANRFKK